MKIASTIAACASAALLGGMIAAAPAKAGLSVCNKTEHPATVALGFFDGKLWSSAGWWTINASGCTELIAMPLSARFYYLYAVHEGVGGAWDGDRSFCVKMGPFKIEGRTDCLARGNEIRRFFQVDTGNSPDWIENLAD